MFEIRSTKTRIALHRGLTAAALAAAAMAIAQPAHAGLLGGGAGSLSGSLAGAGSLGPRSLDLGAAGRAQWQRDPSAANRTIGAVGANGGSVAAGAATAVQAKRPSLAAQADAAVGASLQRGDASAAAAAAAQVSGSKRSIGVDAGVQGEVKH